jgi:hypothetical protein
MLQEVGGIQNLVRLLSFEDPQVRSNACKAVTIACKQERNQEFLREAGCVGVLMNLLQENDSNVSECAAEAMSALAKTG